MDKAWKVKWIEALRSGKYTQTTQNRNHYCLGVLRAHTNGDYFHDGLPSAATLKKVGLDIPEELASMNDEGKTFLEIADRIEAKL